MKNCVETSEGPIPYLHKNGFDMPVALRVFKKAPPEIMSMLAKPDRDPVTGDLVYVSPGGFRVLA